MTKTLNNTNGFIITKEDIPKTISSIGWNSKIPEGSILRIEYDNGAFIDIENKVNSETGIEKLRVSYSQTVFGEDGGNSTMSNKDMLGEWTNTFKKKVIHGGFIYDN